MTLRELEPDHEQFRAAFRAFVEREVVPHASEWAKTGVVGRELFTKAGAAGFLGISVPESYGGGGVDDFRYNMVMSEEFQRHGALGPGMGITLTNDIVIPYLLEFGTEEQKQRWLPDICSGEKIVAIAMTEPSTGSDLSAIRTKAARIGDGYVINGSKTFVSNGINADLIVTVVSTGATPDPRHGLSLIVVETESKGFHRGRNLDKIGLHAQDTAEVFFEDVAVPLDNLLGAEGGAFLALVSSLPRERVSIAMTSVAAARFALDWTLSYCQERTAFGKTIGDFQNTRMRLAEMATEVEIGQHFVDVCVAAVNAGDLTAEKAAMAKWWCSEMQGRVVDTCVQLHGGYGYMTEYPIARAYADARISRIYGGTTEIMKEVISRQLLRG